MVKLPQEFDESAFQVLSLSPRPADCGMPVHGVLQETAGYKPVETFVCHGRGVSCGKVCAGDRRVAHRCRRRGIFPSLSAAADCGTPVCVSFQENAGCKQVRSVVAKFTLAAFMKLAWRSTSLVPATSCLLQLSRLRGREEDR